MAVALPLPRIRVPVPGPRCDGRCGPRDASPTARPEVRSGTPARGIPTAFSRGRIRARAPPHGFATAATQLPSGLGVFTVVRQEDTEAGLFGVPRRTRAGCDTSTCDLFAERTVWSPPSRSRKTSRRRVTARGDGGPHAAFHATIRRSDVFPACGTRFVEQMGHIECQSNPQKHCCSRFA